MFDPNEIYEKVRSLRRARRLFRLDWYQTGIAWYIAQAVKSKRQAQSEIKRHRENMEAI